MNKKLFSYILSFALAIPMVLADAPTVRSGLVEFANGVKGALRGNTGSLIDGLIAVAPVIGLFVVVFGLVFYLFKLTLFKDNAHAKYARMIAIGVALIGVAQQTVFNAILMWSTNFLVLAFILAIVFMFIMFLNSNRKHLYDVNKDMYDAQKGFLSAKGEASKAKRALDKLEHEIGLDKKLYAKTDKDLASLEHDLSHLNKLYGDELRQVDHLAELLRKATAAANRGENNQVHGYVQALSRDLGSLVSTMQHEHRDDSKVHKLLSAIRKNLSYAFKDEKGELSEDAHIKKILHHHIKNAHSISGKLDDKKIDEIAKRVHHEGSDLHRHLVSIKNAALSLKDLEDRVESFLEELEKYSYQSKHTAASAIRDAVMTQDFPEAHKQLDHLRSLIEHGRQKTGDVAKLESEMRSLVSQIEQHEKALAHLTHNMIHDIDAEIKKEGKDLKTKQGEVVNFNKTLKTYLEHAKRSISSFTHRARPIVVRMESGGFDDYSPIVEKTYHLLEDTLKAFTDRTHDVDKLISEVEGLIEGKKDKAIHTMENFLLLLKGLRKELDAAVSTLSHTHGVTAPEFTSLVQSAHGAVKEVRTDLVSGTNHSLLILVEKLKAEEEKKSKK